ncbi:uncharacterized protein MELLADRAFT_106073 [Melampsora larici-populina 98AG31]|uniref:PXA domain-containing protein n=1 Tax=Melampsora larici-populina (strain 98AG31 / pathotype 3-4-7) TaxID=747676 RepID=F4RKA5_MELLP|nr:uncharacterized protein MELLADRAFT_106073 [Melampsora larici-populina 98AG31]EGG07214.1 hypothetical protein MELLADRAFT_106073 [Melampsora larici-populina 98AG31]
MLIRRQMYCSRSNLTFLIDLSNLINHHLLDCGIEPDSTLAEDFVSWRPHLGVQLTTVIAGTNGQARSFLSPQLVNPISKLPNAQALPSPMYLGLLIEALMDQLLPAEDWASVTERQIICEIIANVILVPFFCKLSKPATIYSLIAVCKSNIRVLELNQIAFA